MNRLAFLLCLGVLLSGCSTLKFWEDDSQSDAGDESQQEVDDDWETGFDEDVESTSEPKELEDFDETVKIKKLWRSSVGDGQDVHSASLSPAISGQQIFTADPEGVVSAFSVNDGDRIWRTKLEIALTGGVGVGAGSSLVFVGSRDGELIALAADTGEERWRTALTSEILAPPAAAGEWVVAQTQDGKIHGLSATSGEPVWRYVAELPVLSLRGTAAPVVADNKVVVGFANGKLVTLTLATGGLLWETKLVVGEGKTELERMMDVNTPILVGNMVYATSYQGKVGALSRGAGRELWSHSSSSFRAPAYRSGRLYVVDTDDKIHSYRASGGKSVWVNENFTHRKLAEPLALQDHLAVADREGYLHILSTDDGKVAGRVKVDGDGVSVAMIASQVTSEADKDSEGRASQESFFVLDNSGDLTAYRLQLKAKK